MTDIHKVFVSYHHANDQIYREKFEKMMGSHMISGSVEMGDIEDGLKTETIRQKIRDEYLGDTSVTVVLIGTETWKRKHVDWEISSSLRKTEKNPRSGLIGILLPTYKRPSPGKFDQYTIPPRLYDNYECDFAVIYSWTEDPNEMKSRIHDAYNRKSRINPDNSRDLFRNNRSGNRWYD